MKIVHPLTSHQVKIYPLIADFEKFGSHHPYFDRTEKLDGGFRVYETVPLFGFMKIREQYDLTVDEPIPGKTVRYQSQIKKSVFVELIFELDDTSGSNKLIETINIQANPIIRWIMGNMMSKAHRITIGRLDKSAAK